MKYTYSVKDITLVAVVSAILALSSYIMIMPFLFIVCVISLKKSHIIPISLVTSIAIYLIGGYKLYSLTNLLFLPLIAITILLLMHFVYNQKTNDIICLTRNNRIKYHLFTLISFSLI